MPIQDRLSTYSQRIGDTFCHKLYVLSMFVLWSYVSDVALYVGCSCLEELLDIGALIEMCSGRGFPINHTGVDGLFC